MPRKGRKAKKSLWQCKNVVHSKPRSLDVSSLDTTSTPSEYSVAGHSPNTMELLKRDKKHCDAVIEAGGEKFSIHKSVFAIYSDYFDKVFTIEMQEKYNNEVKLEDTRADVMKCIVDFIYTGQLSINRENAIELLVAADYLHIEKIKKFSVKFLLNNVDAENCISLWICAKTYDVTDLQEKSEVIFGTNVLSVDREELEWLSSEHFLEIMRSSKEMRNSAEESFCITADWANCDSETRKDAFGKMFQSFDLSLFSNDFLGNIAKNEPLITKSTDTAHHVITELLARLDEATEREEKANQRIAKLEEDKQASWKKTDWLVEENKRLTQQAWESDEQAEQQKNVAIEKVDGLVKANKSLEDHLQSSEYRAQQVLLQQKASARKITSLLQDNKSLTEKLQKSTSMTQRAEAHRNNLALQLERLSEENRELTEEVEEKVNFHSVENERLNDLLDDYADEVEQDKKDKKKLEKRMDDLKKQNEQLNEQLDDYADDAEKAEDEKQELESRIDELENENERLYSRLDVAILKTSQAQLDSFLLQEKFDDCTIKKQRNSEAAEMWYDRYSESTAQYSKAVASARDAGHNISRLINDSSKSSSIWSGIYLSCEDKRHINARLKQIESLKK